MFAQGNPPKGLTVILQADSIRNADYIVLQCIASGLDEAICLPAFAVIWPFSLRCWEMVQAKSLKKPCKMESGRACHILEGQAGNATVIS